MEIQFTKYQGTGNDFILIDNRDENIKLDKVRIQKLTDRKFGIGADGLMLIEHHPEVDFKMTYYNSDGSQSLCGNGSRCAVDYAKNLGLLDCETTFLTTDGVHKAFHNSQLVDFQLHDVNKVVIGDGFFFVDNGSPHHVKFVENIEAIDVMEEGSRIRQSKMYEPNGTNVNFVEIKVENEIAVRTFERGVENETLSCGTGVVASAIASTYKGLNSPIGITTMGGNLSVKFDQVGESKFRNIFLSGPVEKVFEGKIQV